MTAAAVKLCDKYIYTVIKRSLLSYLLLRKTEACERSSLYKRITQKDLKTKPDDIHS